MDTWNPFSSPKSSSASNLWTIEPCRRLSFRRTPEIFPFNDLQRSPLFHWNGDEEEENISDHNLRRIKIKFPYIIQPSFLIIRQSFFSGRHQKSMPNNITRRSFVFIFINTNYHLFAKQYDFNCYCCMINFDSLLVEITRDGDGMERSWSKVETRKYPLLLSWLRGTFQSEKEEENINNFVFNSFDSIFFPFACFYSGLKIKKFKSRSITTKKHLVK